MSNASSVKINASQELKHLVNGEKNEREKNPRLSNLFWVSHEDFKVCICKYIYNPHNLPLWLITQCWWEAAAMSCFQDKYKSLGSGRGSTFWFQKTSPVSPSLVPKASLRGAGQPPPSSSCSTACHSYTPLPCGHVAPKPEQELTRSRAWLLS